MKIRPNRSPLAPAVYHCRITSDWRFEARMRHFREVVMPRMRTAPTRFHNDGSISFEPVMRPPRKNVRPCTGFVLNRARRWPAADIRKVQ